MWWRYLAIPVYSIGVPGILRQLVPRRGMRKKTQRGLFDVFYISLWLWNGFGTFKNTICNPPFWNHGSLYPSKGAAKADPMGLIWRLFHLIVLQGMVLALSKIPIVIHSFEILNMFNLPTETAKVDPMWSIWRLFA